MSIDTVAKTLADRFRDGRLVDRSVAVEGLRAALDQSKATASEIPEAYAQTWPRLNRCSDHPAIADAKTGLVIY